MISGVAAQAAESTVWELSHATRHLRCADPRDKVYALLGVAQIFRDFQADYGLPLANLMNQVLRIHHQSEPPQSMEEVAEQCDFLGLVFGDTSAMFERGSNTVASGEADDHRFHLGPVQNFIALWWTHHYRQAEAQQLLIRSSSIDWSHILVQAAGAGRLDVVQVLAEVAPIDLDATHGGTTPLEGAIWGRHHEIVEYLSQSILVLGTRYLRYRTNRI